MTPLDFSDFIANITGIITSAVTLFTFLKKPKFDVSRETIE